MTGREKSKENSEIGAKETKESKGEQGNTITEEEMVNDKEKQNNRK
jgi:hypothetical protein